MCIVISEEGETGRMERFYDSEEVNYYLHKYNIPDFFDTKNLPFYLTRYEKGDFLVQPMRPAAVLQFLVSGSVAVYSVRSDGSMFTVFSGCEFSLLGDVEYVDDSLTIFFAEAKTEAITVCLAVKENRSALDRDVRFLHYLLQSLTQKMYHSSLKDAELPNLEPRLLYYLASVCPNRTITSVARAADNLHCSRRHLQRVLRKLTEEQVIEQCGRGTYRLRKAPGSF